MTETKSDGSQDTPMPLPLDDLTVVDATASFAGAYASRLLGDLGASVSRVEGSESLQTHSVTLQNALWENGLDQILHLGKRVIENCNLSTPQGRKNFRNLLSTADILFEDTGLLEQEFTWEDLQRLNPGLTVISLSPYGSFGPYSDYPASDLSIWAQSGFAWTTPGMPDTLEDKTLEPPLAPTGISIASLSGGTTAFVAALSAINYKDNRGRHIDVSELDTLVSFNYHLINMYEYTRRKDARGPILHGPNCLLPCKDGWVVLVATLQDHWEKLVEIMGTPEWAPAFPDAPARDENWDALKSLLIEWTMEHTGQEITEMLQNQGLGAHKFNTIQEAITSEQIISREFINQVRVNEKNVPVPSVPFIFSSLPRFAQQKLPSSVQSPNAKRADTSPIRTHSTDSNEKTALPLEGIRVLDFGQFVAVPFAARWLAALGADVILVESQFNPRIGRAGLAGADSVPGRNRIAAFNKLFQGQRSISLNLQTQKAREIVHDLARISDVIVDNYSTGMMSRWGLAYEDIREINPRLISVSLGAFGRTGPLKNYTGLHSIINAVSGLGEVTGYPGGHGRLLGPFYPDVISSAFVTAAVLAALHHREKTGQGEFVDVSMAECLMTLLMEPLLKMTGSGKEVRREGSRHPSFAPYGIYQSQGDDEWVAITVRTPTEWQAFCKILGREEWILDSRYSDANARKENQDDLDKVIKTWARERTKYEVADLLRKEGVPAAPCLAPWEVSEDPHLDSTGSIAAFDHPEVGPRRTPSLPWRFDGQVLKPLRAAPLELQHTPAILHDLLGMTYDEIGDLVHENVLA